MAHANSGDGKHRKQTHDKDKRHALDDRVHYRGPSRQLGGYEYLDVDTAEPDGSAEKKKGSRKS